MTFRINSKWLAEADKVQDSVQQSAESTLQSAEDEATLGELGIHVGQTCLTQAIESESDNLRDGANLSGYRLAEWLAWHWWRLRWEPARQRPRDVDWSAAHDLACIGGGWLWPNITIKSDGERIHLHARPSRAVHTEPLRYTTDANKIISAATFEEGIDEFVTSVLSRLEEYNRQDTDLHSIWSELSSERQDSEVSLYRRFEACLGFDPDEAEPVLIERLIEYGRTIGLDAMSEAAADDHKSALGVREAARKFGFDTHPGDGVHGVSEMLAVDRSLVPAWKVGVDLAHQLRRQEHLGDRNELLHPATGTFTYRQKIQRAFAGEFLSPIDALLGFLNDDLSDEKQQDAAEHYMYRRLLYKRFSSITATSIEKNRNCRTRKQLPPEAVIQWQGTVRLCSQSFRPLLG